MTAPLDLAAVEGQLQLLRRLAPGYEVPFSGECHALLALLRETRAALQPFARMYEPGDDDVDRMADTCPVRWQYDMYGTQGLTLGDLKRAAAVLGAARDGPA